MAQADKLTMASRATIPFTHKGFANLTVISLLACILLIMGLPSISEARIFACQSGDSTIFQDRPCPLAKRIEKAKNTVSNFPLSIHESWFNVPEQAEDRAFCDRRGCECGRIEKKHQRSLAQAVADALYLDGSWHRYETSYQSWMQAPTSSTESYESHEQMLEASCEIMMSQTLLRTYAEDVVQLLRKRVRQAEERGFDIQQPCLAGVEQACEFFDSVQLLTRIYSDALSLQRVRGEDLVSDQVLTNPGKVSLNE